MPSGTSVEGRSQSNLLSGVKPLDHPSRCSLPDLDGGLHGLKRARAQHSFGMSNRVSGVQSALSYHRWQSKSSNSRHSRGNSISSSDSDGRAGNFHLRATASLSLHTNSDWSRDRQTRTFSLLEKRSKQGCFGMSKTSRVFDNKTIPIWGNYRRMIECLGKN